MRKYQVCPKNHAERLFFKNPIFEWNSAVLNTLCGVCQKEKERIICSCGCKECLYECKDHGNTCKICEVKICNKFNLCEKHRVDCPSCNNPTKPGRLLDCLICDKKFCSCGYVKFSDPKHKDRPENLRICPKHLFSCMGAPYVKPGNAPLKRCNKKRILCGICSTKKCRNKPCSSLYFWSSVKKDFITSCHSHVKMCDFCDKIAPLSHCRSYKILKEGELHEYTICVNCDKNIGYLKEFASHHTLWYNDLTSIIISHLKLGD
jgi:hypothetical protein